MAEYIDREEILSKRKEMLCYELEHGFLKTGGLDAAEIWKSSVMSAQPADVTPVVHGRWEDGQLCSVCDFDRSYFRPQFNYCPNCGAKMQTEATVDE